MFFTVRAPSLCIILPNAKYLILIGKLYIPKVCNFCKTGCCYEEQAVAMEAVLAMLTSNGLNPRGTPPSRSAFDTPAGDDRRHSG